MSLLLIKSREHRFENLSISFKLVTDRMLFNLMKLIILYKTLCDTSVSLVNSIVIVEGKYED